MLSGLAFMLMWLLLLLLMGWLMASFIGLAKLGFLLIIFMFGVIFAKGSGFLKNCSLISLSFRILAFGKSFSRSIG
jgi:hypothetical protein